MISTLSLCPTCYKKIPATISNNSGSAWMHKHCDEHGDFLSLVEPDFNFLSERYQPGTMGNNNNIIINIENSCNTKCSWCYYDFKDRKVQPFEYYENLLRTYRTQKYGWMLSGGEPTERVDYFNFVDKAYRMGIGCTTLTNMINFADEGLQIGGGLI